MSDGDSAARAGGSLESLIGYEFGISVSGGRARVTWDAIECYGLTIRPDLVLRRLVSDPGIGERDPHAALPAINCTLAGPRDVGQVACNIFGIPTLPKDYGTSLTAVGPGIIETVICFETARSDPKDKQVAYLKSRFGEEWEADGWADKLEARGFSFVLANLFVGVARTAGAEAVRLYQNQYPHIDPRAVDQSENGLDPLERINTPRVQRGFIHEAEALEVHAEITARSLRYVFCPA